MISKITEVFNFEEKNPDQQWKDVLFREQEINKLNALKDKINELIDSVNVLMKNGKEEN